MHGAGKGRGRASTAAPTPRFSLSVRPILADTEEKAWAKADEILARATALQDKTGYRKPADGHATAGARRLLALAEQGTRIDKRLWTEIAKLTGANSNTTALVGTPEQVAEVFGDYYDLGISHFLIRGFDPLIDAIDYGRELIPLTRKLIAGRGIAQRRGGGMMRIVLHCGPPASGRSPLPSAPSPPRSEKAPGCRPERFSGESSQSGGTGSKVFRGRALLWDGYRHRIECYSIRKRHPINDLKENSSNGRDRRFPA